MYWNPQRYLPAGARPEVIAHKQALILQEPTDAAARRARFEALRAATAALRPPLAGREAELHSERDRTDRALEANAVLRRRDYAFCLYPEDLLRPFCTQFL